MRPRKTLSNSVLMKEIRNLVSRGNAVEVRLIQHLAEFLERELHLAFGVSSAFAYLTGELGFSRDVALKRIRAARALTVRPEALEQLALGRLSVSSLAALGSAIEIPELYEYSLGRSKREVELRVALMTKGRSPRGDRSRVAIETPDGNVAVLYRMPPEVAAKIATVAALFEETAKGPAEASFCDTLSASMDLVIESLEAELESPPPGAGGPISAKNDHSFSRASASSDLVSAAGMVRAILRTHARQPSSQSREKTSKIDWEPGGKLEHCHGADTAPAEHSAPHTRADGQKGPQLVAEQGAPTLARPNLIATTGRWVSSIIAATVCWFSSRAPPAAREVGNHSESDTRSR